MKENFISIFELPEGYDEKSISLLLNAINTNSLQGFDYIKYKQSIQAMLSMNIDEDTALKSTLATASTMGITKEKLLKTVAHYRRVLDDEKNLFDNALKNQMNQRVASRLEESEYLEKKIVEYQEKIKELESELVKMKDKIASAGDHIKVEKTKIIETKDRFEQSYKAIVKTLDKDIKLIKN